MLVTETAGLALRPAVVRDGAVILFLGIEAPWANVTHADD